MKRNYVELLALLKYFSRSELKQGHLVNTAAMVLFFEKCQLYVKMKLQIHFNIYHARYFIHIVENSHINGRNEVWCQLVQWISWRGKKKIAVYKSPNEKYNIGLHNDLSVRGNYELVEPDRKMNMFNGLFVLENMLHNSDTLQFSVCLYKTC